MPAQRTKPPRNIIRFDQVSGREIKDWIWFHSHNGTRYTQLAKGAGKYFNLLDNEQYRVCFDGGCISVK